MLLQGLDRTLFRPCLVCTPQLAARISRDVPQDVEMIPLALEEPTQVSRMMGLSHILRDRKIQILHSHGFYSSLCASAVGWWSKTPVIIETSHGREAWRKGWRANFFVDRLVGHFVDRYIAVSEANARYLIHDKGLPAKKVTVIYPGTDLRKFDPTRRAPAAFREAAGIDDDDPVIVFVGRLEPQKGHSVLLDAMPAIRGAFPNVKLICAGEGSLRAELDQKVRDLALQDSAWFVGYPQDVRDWLAIADLTVLPSFYEGLPVTPIESLASGKPVVATAVDGTPEVVIDGKTGLTVPPGDPKRLAEAICRLLGDPQMAQRLGEQGREWVLNNFSVERLIQRTEGFYSESWENRMGQTKAADLRTPGESHVVRQNSRI
jgi:glycosyltransferase involved in cell wall biosynthesis